MGNKMCKGNDHDGPSNDMKEISKKRSTNKKSVKYIGLRESENTVDAMKSN